MRVSSAVMTVTPVQTVWLRPESREIMETASSRLCGLPNISPSIYTTVSLPMTAAVSFCGSAAHTAAAFRRESSRTAATGPVPGAMVSSQSLVRTVNRGVMMESSSRRRGLALARMSSFMAVVLSGFVQGAG